MSAIERVLREATEAGVTPGAVGVVGVGGHPDELVVCAGHLSDEGAPLSPQLAGPDTIYDLASLTKILSCTVLAAAAVAAGKLALDEEPFAGWPGATVARILQHRAGLLNWAPFYEAVIDAERVGLPEGRDLVVERVLATPPVGPAGRETVYSDLGFIALGALLEDRLGERLDRLFDDVSRALFGAHALAYVPLFEQGMHPRMLHCAPTERCPWRLRVVRGQVHDDNCFAMGGIAGHAGLFGTALDVAQAAAFFLDVAQGQRRGAVEDVLAGFMREDGERALGFDRPSPGGSTGGALSPRAVGHLGFTGTSLWVDPAAAGGRGAYFVLLTNRVHPRRDGEGIGPLRQAFHRAAVAAIDEGVFDEP